MFVALPETFQVFENLEGLPKKYETIQGFTIAKKAPNLTTFEKLSNLHVALDGSGVLYVFVIPEESTQQSLFG